LLNVLPCSTEADVGGLANRAWSVLTACLDDYTVDSRGDVGSWARIAACESLQPIFKHISPEHIRHTIGKLLRLSVEKLDRVRNAAGQSLCSLVPHWKDAEEELAKFIKSYHLPSRS